MKSLFGKILAGGFVAAILSVNASAAVLGDLKLSGSTAVAAGNSLTISELYFAGGGGTSVNEIDSVIGFDPAVFVLSNFGIASQFSSWSTTLSQSPSSGIYDYVMNGPNQSLTLGNTYTVLTFTLTALSNAPSGVSNLILRAGDGGIHLTEVLFGESVISLSPSPSNTFNTNDLAITVTGSGAPEPATFLLMGLPLAGLAIRRRFRSR